MKKRLDNVPTFSRQRRVYENPEINVKQKWYGWQWGKIISGGIIRHGSKNKVAEERQKLVKNEEINYCLRPKHYNDGVLIFSHTNSLTKLSISQFIFHMSVYGVRLFCRRFILGTGLTHFIKLKSPGPNIFFFLRRYNHKHHYPSYVAIFFNYLFTKKRHTKHFTTFYC